MKDGCDTTRAGSAETQRSVTRRITLALAAAAVLLVATRPIAIAADQLPATAGSCARTAIAAIGTRLVDSRSGKPIPGSGSAVSFANGGAQVSYDEIGEIAESRVGDPVYMCLMVVPQGCPPGDDRGKIYTTTNLRTLKSWTAPDSQHSCGGA